MEPLQVPYSESRCQKLIFLARVIFYSAKSLDCLQLGVTIVFHALLIFRPSSLTIISRHFPISSIAYFIILFPPELE